VSAMPEPVDLSLSLVSHTNVGKTTLARTLLGRDVGEVRDEAHVTETAVPHTLIESAAGDRLLLWDTPGFGDSQRLARRLAGAGRPLGWLLSQVWDRFRDRAFWSSQQAMRHVLERSDVVLYLVNASEAPEDAAYLAAELEVLALAGKPVVALLNQLGPPGSADDEARLVQRHREHLRSWPVVRAVLPLDAFARCAVQEAVLLVEVAALLPPAQQAPMARLIDAWRARQQAVQMAAMTELAQRVARAAFDREALPAAGRWPAPLQALGAALGLAGAGAGSPQAQAMQALAARLDADIQRSTATLIRLHGLDGQATGEVLERLAQHFALRQPLSEGRAALWGGVVTGALAGLKADIASGGLTLGGGLLAGGVLGALAAAGAVHGVNRMRGVTGPQMVWDNAVLDTLLRSALLGYLAVAHHGRGRGAWQGADAPAVWTAVVEAALMAQRPALQELWRRRQAALDEAASPSANVGPAAAAPPEAWVTELQARLDAAARQVLERLYPAAVERLR
jgi:hypothetical protein